MERVFLEQFLDTILSCEFFVRDEVQEGCVVLCSLWLLWFMVVDFVG